MLNALKLAMKASLFALLVLVLGNFFHWGGRSISDQVRVGMAHAERSEIAGQMRGLAHRAVQAVAPTRASARERGRQVALNQAQAPAARTGLREEPAADSDESEVTTPSERQKLRALIRELNHPREETN